MEMQTERLAFPGIAVFLLSVVPVCVFSSPRHERLAQSPGNTRIGCLVCGYSSKGKMVFHGVLGRISRRICVRAVVSDRRNRSGRRPDQQSVDSLDGFLSADSDSRRNKRFLDSQEEKDGLDSVRKLPYDTNQSGEVISRRTGIEIKNHGLLP